MVSTVVVTGAVIVGVAVVLISVGCEVTAVVVVVTITRCAILSSFAVPLHAPAAHRTAMQAAAAPITRHIFLFFVIINPSVLWLWLVFLYHQQYHRAEGYVYQEIGDSTFCTETVHQVRRNPIKSFLAISSYTLPYAFCEQIGKEIRDISDEIPFEIPESWEWCRWGELSQSIQYGYNAPAKQAGRIKMVRISDIQDNKVLWDSVPYCDIEESEIDTYFLQANDILFARTGGTVGKSYLVKDVPEDAIYAGYLIRTRYSNSLCPEYLKFFMESELYWTQLRNGTIATAQPNCNGKTLYNMIVPIPPLEEQHRIVAKIEELLPYIERYGKAEEHLTALNTTFPEALKKSILQEAVQGKLVPQDPGDEPASVLLKRIRAEKKRLVKEGKIKKDKHESVIVTRDKIPYEIIDGKERCIADEVPFELPEGWCWCRLGDILLKLTDGTHSTPKYTESGIPFISVKDVSSGKLDFSNCKHISEKEHTELYDRCNPEIGDILLTKVGTTGIPVIVDTDLPFSLFVSVALLKFNQELLYNKYLLYMINSPLVQEQAAENTKGVGNKNWVMRDIANTLIVIPPIEEQHRIVSKIEEIMPYINEISL